MPELKTLEEHCQFIESWCRTSFFAGKKHFAPKKPEVAVGDIIRNCTPLLYHGLNYAPATWETNEECLAIIDKANKLADLSPEDFEEEMWRFIEKDAMIRAKKFYPDSVGVKGPASWKCGSLTYDPPKPTQPEGWVTFHIANAVGPQSIFDVKDYLPWCFMLLMKEAEIRFGAHELTTGTWLNENDRFLAYFPQEYLDNMSPRPEEPPVPQWHFGWWGQMVSGRGTINTKVEAFVREKGYLPRNCRSSHCSIESMRKHLKENFL